MRDHVRYLRVAVRPKIKSQIWNHSADFSAFYDSEKLSNKSINNIWLSIELF